jgi:hypothetical protein
MRLRALVWGGFAVGLLALSGCNLPGSTSEADRLATSVALTLESEALTAAAIPSDTPVPTETPSPSETPTETPIPSATTPLYEATLHTDANCRRGPGTVFGVHQVIGVNTTVRAVARNADPNNVWLEVEPSAGQTCWLSIITVNVNFNPPDLPVGVIPPTPTFTPGAIAGVVFHDYCDSNNPVQPECVEHNGGYRANGILDLGELSIVDVTVHLGAGDCPSIGLSTDDTGPTTSDGFEFTGLVPGKYCVTVDAEGDGNGSVLLPGQWTLPDTNGSLVNRRTVTVNSGETTAGVTFGWDFDNLP